MSVLPNLSLHPSGYHWEAIELPVHKGSQVAQFNVKCMNCVDCIYDSASQYCICYVAGHCMNGSNKTLFTCVTYDVNGKTCSIWFSEYYFALCLQLRCVGPAVEVNRGDSCASYGDNF